MVEKMKHVIVVSEKVYRKDDGVWKLISSPKPNRFPKEAIAGKYINNKYADFDKPKQKSFSSEDDRMAEWTYYKGNKKIVVLVYGMRYGGLDE